MSCSLSCFENIVHLCRFWSHWSHLCVAKGEREKKTPTFQFPALGVWITQANLQWSLLHIHYLQPQKQGAEPGLLFLNCCSKFPVVQTLFFELNHKLQVLEVQQGGEKLPAKESSKRDKECYHQHLQIGGPMKISTEVPMWMLRTCWHL